VKWLLWFYFAIFYFTFPPTVWFQKICTRNSPNFLRLFRILQRILYHLHFFLICLTSYRGVVFILLKFLTSRILYVLERLKIGLDIELTRGQFIVNFYFKFVIFSQTGRFSNKIKGFSQFSKLNITIIFEN